MSYYSVVKKSVANTAGAAAEVYTAAVTNMGWTIHDDQSGESPPFYVFKTTGENSDRFPLYLWMRWGSLTDHLEFRMYLHWNATAHTGTVAIYQSSNTSLLGDDDSAYTLWVYGDKDGFDVISKVGAVYEGQGIDWLDSYYKAFGTLTGSATAGNDKILQLGTNEADDFVAGQSYMVVGSGAGEGRERPQVTNVDTVNHRITVDNLARALSVGSVVGRIANKWILAKRNGAAYYILHETPEGTGDFAVLSAAADPIVYADMDPNRITGNYDMFFGGLKIGNIAPLGMFTRVPKVALGSGYEDTVGIDEQATGTSSGSNTSTTLNDTGEAWTTDEWDGYCLIITSGTGIGEMREIASNTATEITVTAAWVNTPDATSGYAITKKGYRYFSLSSQYWCFKEVDGGV